MLDSVFELANGLPANLGATIGGWIAVFLTLAVFSYILGDNIVFRLAEHIFVGVAAGYATALTWSQVLAPRLVLLLQDPAPYWYYGVFFVLGLLLFARGMRPLSTLANLPLGILFGVGAALALGGSLTGSLIPQLRASFVSVQPGDYGKGLLGWAFALDALLLVIGTIAVLSAFHFSAEARGWVGRIWHETFGVLGAVGRGLLMVTFGALLAGATYSFFAILNSRLVFLLVKLAVLTGRTGP
jgi:hypothetical protein